MKDNKTGSGRPRKRRLKSALAIYETSTPLSQTRYVGRAHGADFPLGGGGGGGIGKLVSVSKLGGSVGMFLPENFKFKSSEIAI